jgi:SAM-dependent methyltransferase
MVCLEPNPDFCDLAKMNCRSYPSVKVINQSFEEWNLEPEAFDAVLAASSMHWIPSEIAYAKASNALKDDGFLIPTTGPSSRALRRQNNPGRHSVGSWPDDA